MLTVVVLFFASTGYCMHLPSPSIDIDVVIDVLQQANNQPLDFVDISNRRSRRANATTCSPEVCNHTCNTPLDYKQFDDYVSSSCPLKYNCDYDPQRIPQYLYHAECLETLNHSRLVYYPIPVLKTVEPSCDALHSTNTTWRWEMQVIPVACVCETPVRLQ